MTARSKKFKYQRDAGCEKLVIKASKKMSTKRGEHATGDGEVESSGLSQSKMVAMEG